MTWSEPEPQTFKTGPYIVLGGPGEAYVALKADVDSPPIVEWWREPSPGDKRLVLEVRAKEVDDLWIATLTDLPIDEPISYRVRSTAGDSEVHRFHVGRTSGKPFRFAVFGDTRSDNGIHRAVVEAVTREDIDFIVNTGDMVERGGVQAQWDRFFQIERPLLIDTPIIPAVGNHDFGSRNYFRHYFLHRLWAKNRRYFVADWGNLRIVVVDSGIECRDGCAQYLFAERALQEGAEQGKLMAIMLHFPPYSSGKHGSIKEVQRPITDLARRHGVELVLTGHDHDYERSKPIYGTTYVVSGSAGAPIRPVIPQAFTARARTEPHYVLVDVEKDRLILRAVNLQGDTFDTYVIDDLAPQPDL